MICRLGGVTHAGWAIDLAAAVAPDRLARAVRTGSATDTEPRVAVEARTPGRLHAQVGCVRDAASLRVRTALATAARTRGWQTAYDRDLRAARAALSAIDAPDGEPATAARQRVAAASEEVDRLRERVATARGRVEAEAADDAQARLTTAIRELSEAETAAVAARERHRRERSAAREDRDRLQERLRRRDRVDNLERRARRALVDRARPLYCSALAAVPGVSDTGRPFEAPADAMALAVAKVGVVRAPVVLATGRFPDARAAATWLDAPVVRLEP